MSLFKNIFGSNESEKVDSNLNWINLNHIDQLDLIINESREIPVIIFKHSTRCSISRMVLKQFEKQYNLEEKMKLYFLDLLEYRVISNEIAARFNVVHQSPQVLVINDGISVYNASHESILDKDLEVFV